MSDCILHSAEIDFYVSQISLSKIEDLGSLGWFEKHKRLQLLHQQSVLEANESSHEKVKELIVFHKKVELLVFEAITVNVWREKVFPKILKKELNPDVTFPLYIIMYHETTALGLLQNILYHQDSAEELGDSAVDLVDYCVLNILHLINCYKYVDLDIEIQDLSVVEDLQKKEKSVAFDIGTRCVSVLRYMVENLNSLPLAITTRIYQRHDVPLLFCQLIELSPWTKWDEKGRMYKFNDSKWKRIGKHQESVITVTESQVWLALRHILMDERARQNYEIDDFRRNQILKVQRHLTEVVLDQISPLVELKYCFSYMEMGSAGAGGNIKKPFILEVIAEFRDTLLNKPSKFWKKIAEKQIEVFTNVEEFDLRQVAKDLASAYDTLDRIDPDVPICSYCGDPAGKFCSKCKLEYYCGR
ncbi:zinc finger MYND domain-containing protein 10-like [Lycorma delicatula]|uniref:zinc finger MYND domain-containing protein 10-like n=1 Tax=Lycorma delicatula TaxID=130591 RepID=UPI003F50D518